MSGVHVTNLSDEVTEKHLKMYFSNPKNGGGHVRQILHPLPHNSAVVLFHESKVVQALLSKKHQLCSKDVSVAALPKQVFKHVVVDLEQNVCKFISTNPHIVEEIQFIGEVSVNFSYEKETYELAGTWHQLEWALNYLDNILDAYDFNINSPREEAVTSPTIENIQGACAPDPRWEQPRHEIKRPNIQIQSPPDTRFEPLEQNHLNFSKFSSERDESKATPLVSKPNKNKNSNPQRAYGATSHNNSGSKENAGGYNDWSRAEQAIESGHRHMGYNKFGDTVRRNTQDPERENATERKRPMKGVYETKDFCNDKNSHHNQEYRTYQNKFGGEDESSDSDSENDEVKYIREGADGGNRRISFADDTNFQENKPRPARAMLAYTSGIDVAHTDFGDVPLTFSFTVGKNINVRVAMDDITKQTTDAIVNPSSPDLSNQYGVSRAIIHAVGYQLQAECYKYVQNNGPLNWAEVTSTAAGGKLSQRVSNILHVVGPMWNEREAEKVTQCLVCSYINCLQYADEKLWLQSIAMPLISAGAFGFPLDVCVQAFFDALLIFSTKATSASQHLKDVHLICFDQDTAMAAITIVQSLLDCDIAQAICSAAERYNTRVELYDFAAADFKLPIELEGTHDQPKQAVETSKTSDIKSENGINEEDDYDEKKGDDSAEDGSQSDTDGEVKDRDENDTVVSKKDVGEGSSDSDMSEEDEATSDKQQLDDEVETGAISEDTDTDHDEDKLEDSTGMNVHSDQPISKNSKSVEPGEATATDATSEQFEQSDENLEKNWDALLDYPEKHSKKTETTDDDADDGDDGDDEEDISEVTGTGENNGTADDEIKCGSQIKMSTRDDVDIAMECAAEHDNKGNGDSNSVNVCMKEDMVTDEDIKGNASDGHTGDDEGDDSDEELEYTGPRSVDK